jgi:hypothetical protein
MLSQVWWLQGLYHMIHREADTREKVEHIVLDLKDRIINGAIQAAYAHEIGGRKILFVHAGLRPAMLSYLKRELGGDLAPTRIAEYMNSVLLKETVSCPGALVSCPYKDQIFEAGPDR